MKVEHVKEQLKEIIYPCLMISNETGGVVLMSGFGTGTLIFKGKMTVSIGYNSSGWSMRHFTPLPSTEQIILQND